MEQTYVQILGVSKHWNGFRLLLSLSGSSAACLPFHELLRRCQQQLYERGYRVGVQSDAIAGRSRTEVHELTAMASDWPIDVLYFADSMGSMTPDDTARMVGWLQWDANGWGSTLMTTWGCPWQTLRAQAEGVNWLDATVTGMGRGAKCALPGWSSKQRLCESAGQLSSNDGSDPENIWAYESDTVEPTLITILWQIRYSSHLYPGDDG